MCGRFALTATADETRAYFDYVDAESFPPRYNIAPGQPVAIIHLDRGKRRLRLVRWGLLPAWVKDPRSFTLLINARSETVLDKPSFRAAMQYRRCLFPATGFYEWRCGPGRGRQPFWIRPREGGLVAFAGLWETWSDRDGSEIDTGCILTTGANATVAPIHDRMPVVIQAAHYGRWLDVRSHPPAEVVHLLRPAPDDFFETVSVGDSVHATANDGPGLHDPPPAGLF